MKLACYDQGNKTIEIKLATESFYACKLVIFCKHFLVTKGRNLLKTKKGIRFKFKNNFITEILIRRSDNIKSNFDCNNIINQITIYDQMVSYFCPYLT